MHYKDCYYKLENNQLSIGNDKIVREYLILDNGLFPISVKDVEKDYIWSFKDKLSTVSTFVSLKNFELSYTASTNNSLSNEFFKVTLQAKENNLTQSFVWEIFPSSPLISFYYLLDSKEDYTLNTTKENLINSPTGVELSENSTKSSSQLDVIDCIPLDRKHYKITTIKLNDKTDGNNELVSETEQSYYNRTHYSETGNMFIADDYISNNAILIVKEAPTHSSSLAHTSDFVIDSDCGIRTVGSGIESFSSTVKSYGTTVCVGSKDNLIDLYKQHYKNVWLERKPLIISNTWGDRNQDAAVNESFMLKEIDCAARLGIDSVMIDDGWQSGITANSKLKSGGVWEGYYSESEDFWSVNYNKFPNGLSPLVESANKKGITLSLWFSPDSSSDFKNWEKDVNTLVNLHKRYNVSYFKLDGVKIRNKVSETRYLMLMEKVYEQTFGKVELIQDITAEDRLGYLYQKQFGILFIENRYTDFVNYFPHHTLKNIWSLAKYFPTTKMHMEVLNNTRNTQLYGDDILAPKNYDIDYLFASVMISNPLIWMEMQHLPNNEMVALQKIISVFKECRDDFSSAEISPIGQKPDGVSFSGFDIKTSNNSGYLLLFREFSKQETFTFDVKGVNEKTQFKSLITNDERIKLTCFEHGKLKASFGKQAAYTLVKYYI